jgi:uncharacterized lipoprotein YmbA
MSKTRVARLTALACGLLILAGCFGSSPPSRFYTLTQVATVSSATALSPEKLLVVGPVIIPDYLNRQQIVTRTGANELVIAEFNRWGGSLGNDISRALLADLSARLGPGGFTVLPWQAIPLSTFKTAYRVPVDIARFDGIIGQEVVLNATWQLLLKQGLHEQPLLSKEVTIIEHTGGGTYEDLVATMGRALQKLGAAVSDSIAVQSAGKIP